MCSLAHLVKLLPQHLFERHLDGTVWTETWLPALIRQFFLLQEVDEDAERAKLREVSKRLYAQLQEAEKKHQEEKERLQVTASPGWNECCLHH